jgi:hypothetical protein
MKLYYKRENQQFLEECAKGNWTGVKYIFAERPVDYRCVVKGLKMSIITGKSKFSRKLFMWYDFKHKFGKNTILDIFDIAVETKQHDFALWIANQCIDLI